MNRKPSGSSMLLSKAIVGFLSFKEAEGLTARSLDSYKMDLVKWVEQDGEIEVGDIDAQKIIKYLNWLRTDYVPHRYGKKPHPLSPKTIRNVWVALTLPLLLVRPYLRAHNLMDCGCTPFYTKTRPFGCIFVIN